MLCVFPVSLLEAISSRLTEGKQCIADPRKEKK
jgi:hypothetical protein